MKSFNWLLKFSLAYVVVASPMSLLADEPKPAPGFEGSVLGLDIYAESLGIVLDTSESMARSLPGIRKELKAKLPKTPTLHVDGCELTRPSVRPEVRGGLASGVVTAVDMLGEHAHVRAILWICDMGDPPNKYGIESMAETLSKHEITLYLVSLANKPGPSVRKLVEQTEGEWKLISEGK